MPDLTNILDQVDEVMKKEKIVKLNDWLRKEGRGGKVVCTPGVYASKDYKSILNAVINFDNFNESNVKTSTEKNFNNAKENSFDNFDRLKNILDIRNNDIKQRFSQILENNIKMNNNKL